MNDIYKVLIGIGTGICGLGFLLNIDNYTEKNHNHNNHSNNDEFNLSIFPEKERLKIKERNKRMIELEQILDSLKYENKKDIKNFKDNIIKQNQFYNDVINDKNDELEKKLDSKKVYNNENQNSLKKDDSLNFNYEKKRLIKKDEMNIEKEKSNLETEVDSIINQNFIIDEKIIKKCFEKDKTRINDIIEENHKGNNNIETINSYLIPTEILRLKNVKEGEYVLGVDKDKQRLYVYLNNNNNWELIKEYLVSTGINKGNKEKRGDNKTPEGEFYIKSIHDSRNWTYKGRLAYGDWFLRTSSRFGDQGIHGTDQEDLLGQRASLGCLRVSKENIKEIKEKYVNVGTKLIVSKKLTYRINPLENFEPIKANKIYFDRKNEENNLVYMKK